MNITKLEGLAYEKQIPLSTAIIAASTKVNASKLFLATLHEELPGAGIYKVVKNFNNIYAREEKLTEVLSDYSIVYSTLLKAYELHKEQSKQIEAICYLTGIPQELMLSIFEQFENLCKKFDLKAEPKRMEDLEVAQLVVALNNTNIKVVVTSVDDNKVITSNPHNGDEDYEELIIDGNDGANQLHTQDCFVIPKPVRGLCVGATRVNFNTLKVFAKLYPALAKKEVFKSPRVNMLEIAKVISLKGTNLFFENDVAERDFNASSASIKTSELLQSDRDGDYRKLKYKVESNELGTLVRNSFYSAEIFWNNGEPPIRFLLNKDGMSYAANAVNTVFNQHIETWMQRIKDNLTAYPEYKRFSIKDGKLINNEAGWEEEVSLHMCKVIDDDIFMLERDSFFNNCLPRYNKILKSFDIEEISVNAGFIVTHPLSNKEFDISEGNEENLHILKNFFDAFTATLKNSSK
tara:strand:- start:1171 stop:2559 length:1389 start_codon:yes stop_codon:yes gene_type:complete